MRTHMTHATLTSERPRRFPSTKRRGTVLVFVLGILALLALVGLGMIARTHTDAKRVSLQSDIASVEGVMDGTIHTIRERLRADIWGPYDGTPNQTIDRPLSDIYPPGGPAGSVNQLGFLENNEPWDKPGLADIWLADHLPYWIGSVTTNLGTVIEDDVLVWPNVSYLGVDVMLPPNTGTNLGSPFMWTDNSRTGSTTIVQYGRNALKNIPILQTPAPGPYVGQPVLPGSTTNVTIRQGRDQWLQFHQPALATAFPGVRPQYPYFDTNRDGVPDLYDADGDGIPDSPISYPVPLDPSNPNSDRTLYAVIRIVDHNGMLNVNSASSLKRTDGSLTFNGQLGGLQRRGRSSTEFLIDGVAHVDDWLYPTNDRTDGLMSYRTFGNPTGIPNPISYDANIVRRTMLGGVPGSTFYTYDMVEEESLRHRGRLVRYDRRDAASQPPTDYRTVDRALRGTTQWSRDLADLQTGSYAGSPRWQKFNTVFNGTDFEGFSTGMAAGWRRMLDEDDPSFIRKPLLTTVSADVRIPPDITLANAPSSLVTPLSANELPLDTRLRQLWDIGMNWPVVYDATKMGDPGFPEAIANNFNPPMSNGLPGSILNGTLADRFGITDLTQMPPEWARALPIDLNMSALDSADEGNFRAEFIRYAAAAFYLALDELDQIIPNSDQDMKLQGIDLRGAGGLMREYFAWQFALNLYDYRDANSRPTTIEWPTQPGVYITGVEKQPFFTEAYAYLRAGASSGPGPVIGPGSGASDKWYFAVELFMPPGWAIRGAELENLYFRSPGTSMGLVPLADFRQVTTDTALRASGLDGGPVDVGTVTDNDHGNYFVFVGNRTHEPLNIASDPDFVDSAYFDNRFRIHTDGRGSVELVYSPTGVENDPLNVTLDVIGPQMAGGALASNSDSGVGRWATRLPSMAENQQKAFSLRRSTKGWRFTTAWHVYSEAPSLGPTGPAFGVSLGKPNEPITELTNQIPESVWPNLTSFTNANGRLTNPFLTVSTTEDGRALEAFEAFDSVADLSRQFFIGPVNLDSSPILNNAFSNLNLPTRRAPATLVLAQILQEPAVTDLPNQPKDRIAAGRVDFFNASRVGGTNGRCWTWKLFDYFTVRSIGFDNLDNDGDGFTDINDPTESWTALFRENGRINLHTAPATVLRSGPAMSLLPTSPELVDQERRAGVAEADLSIFDPYNVFSAATSGSWVDFPSAIVALRDNRDVPVRFYDPTTSSLQTAAVAQVSGAIGPGSPSGLAQRTSRRDGAFYGPVELTRLRGNKVIDALGGHNLMFDVRRLSASTTLPLGYNSVPGGTNFEDNGSGAARASRYSPDFRYRSELVDGASAVDTLTDFVPIQAAATYTGNPVGVESDLIEGAGIRGRDIYVSRWSNVFTTRSDVFTAYIALIDEDGHYVRRAQLTLDRSACFTEVPAADSGLLRQQVLPRILVRNESSYSDDTR